MKAIVLFDTLFGNTERIASRLAAGLQATGIVAEDANIKGLEIERLVEYDLIALGAPTQYLTASKPMKDFLERLKAVNLRGKSAFAFDTRYGYPLSGSAAKFIEKKLKHLGLEIIRPRSSATVVQQKTAVKVGDSILKEGTEAAFEVVGKELGELLCERARKAGNVVA